MYRCLALAKLGRGLVAPNPMVGAVLVYNNNIIGEGYHQQFGGPHAEVNCINNVAEVNKQFIKDATLYVSLEPCNHFGKTPPCTHLIIEKKIKNVVIGCQDPFAVVNGKGIQFLLDNKVNVICNILADECVKLNKYFFTFHQKKRPYILLKFAQTADNKIDNNLNERLLISNQFSNKLVHKWRNEVDAILIGTNTAFKDNPSLTNRLYFGKNPIRLVIDKNLILPNTLNIFNLDAKTIIFNSIKNETIGNTSYVKITNHNNIVQEILDYCFKNKIISLIVEGGAKLIDSFIENNIWDEARIITNTSLKIDDGVKAPYINGVKINSYKLSTDDISYYLPNI